MNSATASYQESSHFIHQRYEDTAHIIFNQQQKVRQDEKRREKQQGHAFQPQNRLAVAFPYKELEVNRFGNRAVLASELQAQGDSRTGKSVSPPRGNASQPTTKSVSPPRSNTSQPKSKSTSPPHSNGSPPANKSPPHNNTGQTAARSPPHNNTAQPAAKSKAPADNHQEKLAETKQGNGDQPEEKFTELEKRRKPVTDTAGPIVARPAQPVIKSSRHSADTPQLRGRVQRRSSRRRVISMETNV